MILPGMAKDIVTLVKENGEKIENVKAVVSSQRVITFQIDLMIDAKDLIVHKLDSGTVVTYLVLEPTHMPICDGIPAHYHLLVRKISTES